MNKGRGVRDKAKLPAGFRRRAWAGGLLLTLAGVSLPGRADIYKYVDKDGRVTFTNIYVKGAVRLDIDTTPAPAKPKKSAAPAHFPRVDPATQRKRDDLRRKILQEELASETKLLESAKQALAEGEAVRMGDERHNYQKYLDRVQKLKDAVALHEQNIAAIRQELAAIQP